VIFWMFFTDFNRIRMSFKVAMLRVCVVHIGDSVATFTAVDNKVVENFIDGFKVIFKDTYIILNLKSPCSPPL